MSNSDEDQGQSDGSDSSSSSSSTESSSSDSSRSSSGSSIVILPAAKPEYFTPEPVKKKVVRRTNLQIQADAAVEASTIASNSKSTSSKSTSSADVKSDTLLIMGNIYSLQPSRTVWSVQEQLDLISCYKSWEDDATS